MPQFVAFLLGLVSVLFFYEDKKPAAFTFIGLLLIVIYHEYFRTICM